MHDFAYLICGLIGGGLVGDVIGRMEWPRW